MGQVEVLKKSEIQDAIDAYNAAISLLQTNDQAVQSKIDEVNQKLAEIAEHSDFLSNAESKINSLEARIVELEGLPSEETVSYSNAYSNGYD